MKRCVEKIMTEREKVNSKKEKEFIPRSELFIYSHRAIDKWKVSISCHPRNCEKYWLYPHDSCIQDIMEPIPDNDIIKKELVGVNINFQKDGEKKSCSCNIEKKL